MDESLPLGGWIAHIFDHPATDPAWYWEQDAPEWDGGSEQVALFIAETFERSGELLSQFSDAQLNQGFWYLVSGISSDFMHALNDQAAPLSVRLRALRSFVPLFEQVIAVRCSQHLSHLDQQPANVLNSACYMWWDVLPLKSEPEKADRAEFDGEVLRVLSRLLAIPHDACRESAFSHGISEWQFDYPKIQGVVDDFLASTPGLRAELVSYAQRAKVGNVQ